MRVDPRRSYPAKLVAGFGVVLIVVAALGAFTVVSVGETVEANNVETISGEATAVGDVVEATLDDLRGSAITAADETSRARERLEISAETRDELNSRYQRRSFANNVAGLHLVDPESGEVLASSQSAAVGDQITAVGIPLPETVKRGGTQIAYVDSAGENGSWVVYAGTNQGNLIVQRTPYSYVDEAVDGFVNRSRVRIVNDAGVVVYDSRTPAAVGTQHTDGEGVSSPAVRAGLNGSTGSTSVSGANSATGTELVVGHSARIGSTNWVAVSYAEPSVLFASVGEVRNNLFVLLGGVAVALVGFGLVVERPAVRELRRLTRRVGAMESGDLETAVETERRDEFGELGDGLEAMRTRLRERIEEAERATEEAEAAREDAEAAREEAEALSNHLETKADDYRVAIQTLAEGDFTVRVDPESDHDGMREIGETLNEVVGDLETTLAGVQGFATEVADSMTALAASADEIESATADVSGTVQSISAGTDEQRERLASVADEMGNMSATVEEVAATSGEVADNAATAAELSREGRDAAEDAVAALDEVEGVTAEAVEEVDELVEQVEQIEQFADVIGDIAEQTDMLALNANVEAARTDSDSDGFAVVADEIKQLAEEAGDRADDIEALVSDVTDQTTATADRMRTTNERLRSSVETVETAIDALVDIGEVVERTNDGVQNIDQATDDQAATTEEVTATVEEVREIATENADEASDAAAAAEQQTATVSEVARTAEQIASEADDLRAATDRFTVAAETAGGERSASDGGTDGDERERRESDTDDATSRDPPGVTEGE
ncbi:methyl-accepting chemotaxis protein [Halobaculum sp. MBLA0147]|uniref:methyl-accepting chemotaxis protein n=1 Tax=Halobaculum sp. MBLA0147 TaxID=3079934 RepID=UPI00352662ED